MKNSNVLIVLSVLLLSACGYSEKEGKAAGDFCMCASNKAFLQKTDCLKFAAGLNQIDVNSDGFKRAVKEKCPNSYNKMKKSLEKYRKQSEK